MKQKYLEDEGGISPDAITTSYEHFASCLLAQDELCPCSEWVKLIGLKDLKEGWVLPDPKVIVEQALANITNIHDFLEYSAVLVEVGMYTDSEVDMIDAMSLPVLMVVAAVDAMDQIKEAGGEIEESKRNNITLLALIAIFFVIPGVGEALSTITGIATIVAEMEGAGIGVFNIANDPSSAPLEIFGLVLGGLAIKDVARGWASEAAIAGRGMSTKSVSNMGKIVEHGLGHIDSVSVGYSSVFFLFVWFLSNVRASRAIPLRPVLSLVSHGRDWAA